MSKLSDGPETGQPEFHYPNVVIPSALRLKEDAEYLMQWMSQEPHLPNIDDEEWVKTFLYNNKFSLERTKIALENYYTIRSKYPQIVLKDRDPTAPELLKAKKALRLGTLNRLTKDGCKIVYSKYDADYEIFDPGVVLKRIFMLADAMNLEQVRLAKTIVVADCEGLSHRHYLKLTPFLGAYGEIMVNSYTERVKSFYIINMSRFIFEMVGVMKKVLPATLSSRIRVHQSADDDFRSMFDPHDLASDYGGEGVSLAALEDYVQQLLEKHREWFKEQENVCSNKPLSSKTGEQLDNMKGSFRKLEID